MSKVGISVILFLMGIFSNANAAVIFQENFDSQADWTYQQYGLPGGDTNCWVPYTPTCSNPSTQPPPNWDGWFNGLNWCPQGGGVGSNNMYINAIPGYPIETTGTCRGGAGKCSTYWAESCTANFINSDGLLAKKFRAEYPEIYVRFYIKFKPGWRWETSPNDAPQHKLLHIQHVGDNVYSPFAIGSNDPGGADPNKINVPMVISGIHVYSGFLYYYVGYRGERTYFFYNGDVGTNMDFVSIGAWASTLGDGNWHSMEFYVKMNTNTGGTFNTDGNHKFWFDGVLRFDSSTHGNGGIQFSGPGSETSPRRGINYISVGGNNSNYWNTSGTVLSREQWYAIDDIYVATEIPGSPMPPRSLSIR